MVCDLVCSLNKEIDFELCGEEIDFDKNFVEVLVDFLIYLVCNLVDYGIEMLDECVKNGKFCIGKVILFVL